MYKLYAKVKADKMMMTLSVDSFFSQAHTKMGLWNIKKICWAIEKLNIQCIW